MPILSAEVVDDQPAQVALKVSYDRAPKRFSMPMGEIHLAKITTDPTMIAGPYSSRKSFRQESFIQLTVRQERTLENWRQTFLDIEGLFAFYWARTSIWDGPSSLPSRRWKGLVQVLFPKGRGGSIIQARDSHRATHVDVG